MFMLCEVCEAFDHALNPRRVVGVMRGIKVGLGCGSTHRAKGNTPANLVKAPRLV